MYKKIFVVILLAVISFSCNNSEDKKNAEKENGADLQNSKLSNSLPDVSGYYQLPELRCNIALTIVNENGVLKYYFKGEHLDLEGVAIVSVEEDIYYVTFDGPIGNTPPKTVQGQFKDNTITIQNTGNTMNNFHYFPDCEDKYLEFKKN
jgi:hypothetical protein